MSRTGAPTAPHGAGFPSPAGAASVLSVQLERAEPAHARHGDGRSQVGHVAPAAAGPPDAGLLALSRAALRSYALALAHAWRVLGVRGGDRVLIYDYGSSPIAYLASEVFAPYLDRGAAELTGATVLCVDGLPDNATRVAHVLHRFQPHFLFARADIVPLIVGGPTAVPPEDRMARLIVSADEERPAAGELRVWRERWHGGVSLLARCDRAAFVAAQCPESLTLRIPGDLYEVHPRLGSPLPAGRGGVETLTVRPRFLEVGHVRTELSVRISAGDARLLAPRPRVAPGALGAPASFAEELGAGSRPGLRLA